MMTRRRIVMALGAGVLSPLVFFRAASGQSLERGGFWRHARVPCRPSPTSGTTRLRMLRADEVIE